jgi:hypothetical protein
LGRIELGMHPKTSALLKGHTRLHRQTEEALMTSGLLLARLNDELDRDTMHAQVLEANGHLAHALEAVAAIGLADILDGGQ